MRNYIEINVPFKERLIFLFFSLIKEEFLKIEKSVERICEIQNNFEVEGIEEEKMPFFDNSKSLKTRIRS